MIRWCKRPWLTGLLALCLGTATASAQEYYTATLEPPLATTANLQTGPVPHPTARPVQPSYSIPVDQWRNPASYTDHQAGSRMYGRRPLLNRFGSGCYSHHDHYGCSSFRSELRFAFGSCRSFFGESCAGGRPIIPAPRPNDPGFLPGH